MYVPAQTQFAFTPLHVCMYVRSYNILFLIHHVCHNHCMYTDPNLIKNLLRVILRLPNWLSGYKARFIITYKVPNFSPQWDHLFSTS